MSSMHDESSRIRAAVLGGGSWGTALAQLLARKGHTVRLWAREPEVIEGINARHENPLFLEGIPLDERVVADGRIDDVVHDADLVLFTIPTQFLRPFLVQYREAFPPNAILVNGSKGIEKNTLATPFEVMVDELPGKYHRRLAVLSGPSFAREVALNMPTNVTVACGDEDVARAVQRMMADFTFRVYRNGDVMGTEIGGAVKNVLAIAAGASDGFGFGHNALAGLITRGLAEMTRLAQKKGGNPLTLAGLAGMGDLVLTCTGDASRNRQVGIQLARGKTLSEIVSSMRMVAEGIPTAISLHQMSLALAVELPICEQVYQVLHEGRPVGDGVAALLGRPLGPEKKD